MADFTKQEIKKTFLELLKEKSLSEISVRELTEKCGINRNTFYYHFRDIPALVEEIVMEQTNALLSVHPDLSSIEECLYAILDLVRDNQMIIRHIYNSLSRAVFEKYLFEVCYVLAENYWKHVMAQAKPANLSDLPNRQVVLDCYASALFGLAMRWLANGLDDKVARKEVPEIAKILSRNIS
ncbi:TetR/AcrR family transcriptional regulator C-terminal domain-containing protein [Candidatus Saccharibacteria bacterium]|nr:TetR/AcrR family transcriptional regulator C-terminal domain-containing protein [Candidatus Saccharibacteria bacterium]